MLITAQTFEPPLVERIGPGTDVVFDKVLDSLTHIAQRQAKAVIDALTRWKKGLSDQVIPPASLQQHVSGLLDRNAQMDTKLRLAKRREVGDSHLSYPVTHANTTLGGSNVHILPHPHQHCC